MQNVYGASALRVGRLSDHLNLGRGRNVASLMPTTCAVLLTTTPTNTWPSYASPCKLRKQKSMINKLMDSTDKVGVVAEWHQADEACKSEPQRCRSRSSFTASKSTSTGVAEAVSPVRLAVEKKLRHSIGGSACCSSDN